MKVSNTTLEIIKNFNGITQTGFLLEEGNRLAVQDGSGIGSATQRGMTMVAIAELEDSIDVRAAISDTVQLYSCLSVFDHPQIEVEGSAIVITDHTNPKAGRFSLAAGSELVVQRVREIAFPESKDNIVIELTSDEYAKIFRGVGIVNTSEVAIIGDNGDLLFSAFETQNPTADQYVLPVGTTNQNFRVVLPVDSIGKLIRGEDYELTISSMGIVRARSLTKYKVTYYIAGKFGG